MAAAHVILVSDTHLSASAPQAQAQANWDAVVSYVGDRAPDLVIHLGDLSLDGARDAMDLRHGRAQLDRLPTPWAVLPDRVQPVLGAKRCGIVSLTFTTGTPAQPEFIEPDGLEQLTVTVDLPDPYRG